MTESKILFSKTSHLDQMDASTMDQTVEKPPTYEESAMSGFVTCAPSTSIDANGSIQISMEKLPTVQMTPTGSVVNGGSGGSGSATGSSVSVDQMVDELSALQRAQMHLYKRLQHVKSQTYAALALVLLMAGLIVIFLATYHHDKPPAMMPPSEVSASSVSHRTGKALVGGASGAASSLLSSNSIVDEDTDALLKHLSRIATSTTVKNTDAADTLMTSKTATTQDAASLQTFKVQDIVGNARSDNSIDAPAKDALPEASNVHVIQTNPTSVQPEAVQTTSTTTASTTTTTTTTTTTSEPETETEPETEKSAPVQDTYNISIVVHSATVPNMDYYPMGRASDTYCDVYIDDVLIGSTPIVDNNNNPNWQYLLPKTYKVRKESSIRVDLLDRDHLKKDHIGGVVMLVGDMVHHKQVNKPVKFFHGRGDVWVTVKLV